MKMNVCREEHGLKWNADNSGKWESRRYFDGFRAMALLALRFREGSNNNTNRKFTFALY